MYTFLLVAVEFEHLFVSCIVLFHCEPTLKPFLMETEKKGEEKLRVCIHCSGLHSLNFVKIWDYW